MWKEYAIEPACLVKSPASFRSLRMLFGAEQGRWIAKYPDHEWRAEVRKLIAEWPDGLTKKGADIWIERDGGFMFRASDPSYDAKAGWLSNAIRHNSSNRFAKILSCDNPSGHAQVVCPLDDNGDDLGACLASPHQVQVPRTESGIASAVGPLLLRAQELLFVDPNFGNEARFSDLLQAALQIVSRRPHKPSRIEYHFKAGVSPTEFSQSWANKIIPALPSGFSVHFVAWKQRTPGEKLHDRFILAPIGGVNISVGLDTGECEETSLVTRLTAETHAKIWGDYQHGKPTAAFELAKGFPIKLTRP